MSELKPLLDRNQAFSETGAHEGLTPVPKHQVIVVTCMDGRVDPAHILGAELGDALVLRNAGGRVTQDVLQEIAFIGSVTDMMFGDEAQPFEVAVIHHTSCGSGFFADPDFRASFVAQTGADDQELADSAVTDPFESVKHDLELLTQWPPLPARASISGHVYNVDTGVITTVTPATVPRG